jgi:hypothetical protein
LEAKRGGSWNLGTGQVFRVASAKPSCKLEPFDRTSVVRGLHSQSRPASWSFDHTSVVAVRWGVCIRQAVMQVGASTTLRLSPSFGGFAFAKPPCKLDHRSHFGYRRPSGDCIRQAVLQVGSSLTSRLLFVGVAIFLLTCVAQVPASLASRCCFAGALPTDATNHRLWSLVHSLEPPSFELDAFLQSEPVLDAMSCKCAAVF